MQRRYRAHLETRTGVRFVRQNRRKPSEPGERPQNPNFEFRSAARRRRQTMQRRVARTPESRSGGHDRRLTRASMSERLLKAKCTSTPSGRRRPRLGDGSQASLESGNSPGPVPPRLPSRPSARARRGPGRGAKTHFAKQKNGRAQNDQIGLVHYTRPEAAPSCAGHSHRWKNSPPRMTRTLVRRSEACGSCAYYLLGPAARRCSRTSWSSAEAWAV